MYEQVVEFDSAAGLDCAENSNDTGMALEARLNTIGNWVRL